MNEPLSPEALAAEALRTFAPIINGPAAPLRANATSAIMTLMRPYVEQAVTGAAPKAVRDAIDRRERRWALSAEIWAANGLGAFETLLGATEGRDISSGQYGDMDRVQGLDAAAKLLAELAEGLGIDSPEFSESSLSKALAYLRPTISRQNGHATMRRTSADGRWHMICDVFREDALPEN